MFLDSTAAESNVTVISVTDNPSSPDLGTWSSAIGHASTGKSGRVIERLQGDIDRLRREKQLLKVRHEEVEKANETLTTTNQYLQDRASNYEQSHEASLRQIARKERQVEDLREELRREKVKSALAEERAQAASMNEKDWRDQASQAKAIASHKESEYETIVSCRNLDNERHQNGLANIRSSFETLLRHRQEDLEKQKKLEIVAEQQRETISQLEELTKKLNANFKAYRTEIDRAIGDLKGNASLNDEAVGFKLKEMDEVTGLMRWVMNVDEIVNKNPPRPLDSSSMLTSIATPVEPVVERPIEEKRKRSKSRDKSGIDVRGKLHKRKGSTKT